MRTFYQRKHPRWRSHDYAQAGAYFVTTSTYRRRWILGEVAAGGVVLTDAGRIAGRWWRDAGDRFSGVTIDTFVVMPNHVHAIVVLSSTPTRTADLSQVIGWSKQRAAREINSRALTSASPVWQRSFHDRIIRDAAAFVQIRRYILANPAKAWRAAQQRAGRL